MKTTTIILTALLFLFSCAPIPYSLNPTSNYTPLSSSRNFQQDTIPIVTVLNGEPINFSYSKIGLVELTGGQSDKTILENFKYQAWKKGGNSVLLIKKERIQQGSSSYTDTSGNTTTSAQFTNKWTGLIAQVPDSVYQLHVKTWAEVDFIHTVEQNAVHTKPNNTGAKLLFTAFMGTAVGAYIYVLKEAPN